MPGVKIDKTYCKGCELCVHACPMGIISMSKEINLKGYFFAQVHDLCYHVSRCSDRSSDSRDAVFTI